MSDFSLHAPPFMLLSALSISVVKDSSDCPRFSSARFISTALLTTTGTMRMGKVSFSGCSFLFLAWRIFSLNSISRLRLSSSSLTMGHARSSKSWFRNDFPLACAPLMAVMKMGLSMLPSR